MTGIPVSRVGKSETAGLLDLEDRLEAAGAPYTPGRIPVWQN